MSSSRFGYPNIKVGKLSNEQNLQNTKSFMYTMSDSVSQYINNLEAEIQELREEINNLRSGD